MEIVNTKGNKMTTEPQNVCEELCKALRLGCQKATEVHFQLIETQLKASEQALILRTTELDRRLEGLNQLRSEVIKDRDQFIRKDTFDVRANEWDRHGTRLTIIETRSLMIMAAVGMFFTIIQIVMHIFWKVN